MASATRAVADSTSGLNRSPVSKLAPSMQRSATRYLTPDTRDFFTVLAR